MTIKSRIELKPHFNTGCYPTQEDFHNWLDSYLHKNDRIPAANIEGINELLNSNNDTLLKEVQKIVDSYHAIDYVAQDLLNVVVTPFKHVLSIHKITNDTEIGFAGMNATIGSVKLIIENAGETDLKLSIQEMANLIVFDESQNRTLAKGCFAEFTLTSYGNYQTLSYRISKKKLKKN